MSWTYKLKKGLWNRDDFKTVFKVGAGKPKHGRAEFANLAFWAFELLYNLNVIANFLLSCKSMKFPLLLRESILLKFELYKGLHNTYILTH